MGGVWPTGAAVGWGVGRAISGGVVFACAVSADLIVVAGGTYMAEFLAFVTSDGFTYVFVYGDGLSFDENPFA